jgi:putative transposase
VDFVRRWSEKTEIGAGRFIGWLDIPASKFYRWRERYGRVNEHNGGVPRDFWLADWEKQAIIAFHLKNPASGVSRIRNNVNALALDTWKRNARGWFSRSGEQSAV